jgi:hypothetical protein
MVSAGYARERRVRRTFTVAIKSFDGGRSKQPDGGRQYEGRCQVLRRQSARCTTRSRTSKTPDSFGMNQGRLQREAGSLICC